MLHSNLQQQQLKRARTQNGKNTLIVRKRRQQTVNFDDVISKTRLK